jgi:protein-S-isoprenylcysteine O-methyltransferase Ste14
MTREAPRLQDSIGRWTGFVVFALVVARQFTHVPTLAEHPVEIVRWGLLTILFILFWSAYWRRRPAIALASRPVQILLPLVCSGLPLAQYPPSFLVDWMNELRPGSAAALLRPAFEAKPTLGLSIMAAGEVFAVAAMVSLGRSFSIFSEVRDLVTSGLYRYVRHPLYLGEMVAVWGYVIAWPAPWGLATAAVFTALQSWRAKVEEGLLSEHHDYAGYRGRAGFLWPRRPRDQRPR